MHTVLIILLFDILQFAHASSKKIIVSCTLAATKFILYFHRQEAGTSKNSHRFLPELKWHYIILAFLLLLYQRQQTLNKPQIVNAVFQTYIHPALKQNLYIGILNQAAKTCIANSMRQNKNTNLIFKTR